MRAVVPVLRFRRLMLLSSRVGENVTPDSVPRPGTFRRVSAPPGKVGRWARDGVG
jgi:hypothetical protein